MVFGNSPLIDSLLDEVSDLNSDRISSWGGILEGSRRAGGALFKRP